MPVLAIAIQILKVLLNDVGRFNRVSGFERLVDDPPGLEIADLDAVERLTFSGLDKFVLDNRARITVDKNLQPTAEFIRVVTRHILCADSDTYSATAAVSG